MLAQRSPRYICRVCLACQSRSTRACRLSQAAGQAPTSADNNVSPITNAPKKARAPRRVPLRELFAKLDRQTSKKAAMNTEAKSEVQAVLDTIGNAAERAPKDAADGRPRSESSTPAVGDLPGTPAERLGETPFEVTNTKGDHRSDAADPQRVTTLIDAMKQMMAVSAISLPRRPRTKLPPKPKPTIQTTDEPPVTRRTQKIGLPDTPMPSAPEVRYQLAPKVADLVKAARPYKVTHTVQELQQHPADPANAVPKFPGSAAREVIWETEDSGLKKSKPFRPVGSQRISAKDIEMKPIQPKEQRPVPVLEHGLDRVLFNPGVTYLQDPRSLVYNFDPYLENIMPMEEFDYDALMEYITSSRDTTLVDMAKEQRANFVGSTSSMTASLCHYHFLISAWRQVNTDMLSTVYESQYKSFTAMTRAPAGIFLRYKGDGIYAIDADKMYDTDETVLQWLGRSMEKMLTLPPEQMEKYRKNSSHTLEPHERGQPEGYHYTLSGTMLMRSQLDCNDGRLPGTGVFDLKTRACIAVRMNVRDYQVGADYEIQNRTGLYNSFEREYYDMIRSAFLKYSLQARIGNMDGIFVAYHNTKRIFGFQYISVEEMDAALHGRTEIGQQEFHFSIKLFNETLKRAAQQFPKKSLRLMFETRDTKVPQMYIFAEPYEENEINAIQNGEYFQALKVAEARARTEKEAKAAKELAELQENERGESEPSEGAESENVEATSVDGTAGTTEPARSTAPREASQDSSETEESSEDEATLAESISETASTDPSPPESSHIEDTSALETATSGTKSTATTPESTSAESESESSDESDESKSDESDESFSATDDLEGETPLETHELPPRDLLAMVLKVQNYINGQQVTTPPNPGPTDKWEISYSFERYTDERAMRIYQMCCDRRRKAHDEEFRDQIIEDGKDAAERVKEAQGKAKDWSYGFLAHLLDLSRRGRAWRKEFNQMFGDREKVVWHEGMPPSNFVEMKWKGRDGKGS